MNFQHKYHSPCRPAGKRLRSQIVKRTDWQKGCGGNHNNSPIKLRMRVRRGLPSDFQGNDLKRTLQCASRANKLAIGAPAAVINFEYRYGIIIEYEGAAFTYCNAKAAAVAPGIVNDWHYGQSVLLLR